MGWLADRFGFGAAFGFLAVTTLAAALIALATRAPDIAVREPADGPLTKGTA
jgi:hypothetical protein